LACQRSQVAQPTFLQLLQFLWLSQLSGLEVEPLLLILLIRILLIRIQQAVFQ
jgi:hypothetical protein